MLSSSTTASRLLLATLCFVAVALTGCPKNGSIKTLSANYFAGNAAEPAILAAYQPWFGAPGHIQVGYSSQDRVQIEKQIDKARQLGISGFVVNWYGQHHVFEDKAYALMQEVAAEQNFKVALLYDEDESDPASATDTVISDLQYAHDHYLGRNATVPRDSYLDHDARPLIFIFPKGEHTDWDRVRQALNLWPTPPLLIFKDPNQKWAKDFDGFYAWVAPGRQGWQSNGSNWGQQYLDDFYRTMIADYPNKIAVGAAWPGFDDSKASWSQNRKMSARCGRTLDDTMRLFRRYYGEQRSLPFLMIETWNDYEEGTAIENGIPTC